MTTSKIWFAAALLAVSGSFASRADAAAPELVVVGGDGAIVGPVVAGPMATGDDHLLWVVHPVGAASVKLLIGENGPWDTKARQPLFYESADCSGTATIDVPSEAGAPRDAVVFDTYVYWPEGPGRDRTVRAAGWLLRDGSECGATLVGENLCCAPLPEAQVLRTAPASGVTLASLRLSAPFRVESSR